MYVYHSAEYQRPLESYLIYGLLVSLVVHLIVGALFLRSSHPPVVVPQQVFEVSLAPLEAIQRRATPPASQAVQRQIVTEPQNPESTTAPLQTRLQAEKDRVVEREQIKRGVDPTAGQTLGTEGSAPKQPETTEQLQQEQRSQAAPKPVPQQAEPKQQALADRGRLSQLRLDQSTLIEAFGKVREPSPRTPTTMRSLSGYQAFSRPRGSGARFLGEQGAPDYLPNLPDGDITLLNTKANRFAVFVRRVATQVFSELRASGWQNLSAGDIRQIKEFSAVRAVLSPEGELLEVQLVSPSGSLRFDEVLSKAVQQGARDPHPPREAAAGDGNIRFVFKARTWTRFAPSGAGGAIGERRWLLLGTGLE